MRGLCRQGLFAGKNLTKRGVTNGFVNAPCVEKQREGLKKVESKMMTVKEVAQYLRLAEITIYGLAESKDLPESKVGRK